ncbi:DUF2975 domain-containing protein [Flavobacterium sp. xlx-214]|uniref:DUF2975 domain-containing protein n=1 Tax=unclassified Flavobacterium TaxID=196869 RepID=UPI0013D5BCDC|nr:MULTISPECIES: DUF2975 domain-containing protein [unclassified Flavobacterium]MBA5793214.1 DUF2975 domain-containing protein [Flavobacterium sp. xlx-221]QMI82503.1 DUF2975 domain-containing protein [Flavobacterium sp. xlx-214]
MKTLNILSFILYIILLAFIIMVPVLIWIVGYTIANIETEIPSYLLFKQEVLTTNNPYPLFISLLIYVIVFIANAYALLLFYKVIKQFKKSKIFDEKVVIYLKQMGYIFAIGYLLIYSLKPIIDMKSFTFFKNSSNGFDTFLEYPINGFIIGLFFLILSKAFQIAKQQKEENVELKQENDLTI